MSCPAHSPRFSSQQLRPRPTPYVSLTSSHVLLTGLLLTGLLCTSCTQPNPQPPSRTSVTSSTPKRILAQGQILPAGGIVQLSAPPGDVVTHISVTVGEQVESGQLLLTLQSGQVAQARLKTLHKRREQAVRERDQAIANAQQQLASADLKLKQLKAQQTATQRTTGLLELAKQQVESSEKVLQKLQAIAANAATSEFVGALEIDRQRIQLSEAELNYRRQAESLQQSEEDLTWGLQAAEQQRQVASKLLAAAESSQAIEILDLEIAALVEQTATTRLVAPKAGMILAVNVAPGEATLAAPLIEMADLTSLVCEVEINAMDAPSVRSGQTATITSRVLGEQALHGTVIKKFSLVGRPQLRSLDPLARADFRTVTATIELDPPSTQIAKDWLQLQVEARIDIGTVNVGESVGDSAAAPSTASAAEDAPLQPAHKSL